MYVKYLEFVKKQLIFDSEYDHNFIQICLMTWTYWYWVLWPKIISQQRRAQWHCNWGQWGAASSPLCVLWPMSLKVFTICVAKHVKKVYFWLILNEFLSHLFSVFISEHFWHFVTIDIFLFFCTLHEALCTTS